MAALTGELIERFDGRDIRLRLTMRSLATLQDEHGGAAIEGIIGGAAPSLSACIRLVELALQKHHADEAYDLADELFTADPEIVVRLVNAAFPGGASESRSEGKRPAAA